MTTISFEIVPANVLLTRKIIPFNIKPLSEQLGKRQINQDGRGNQDLPKRINDVQINHKN